MKKYLNLWSPALVWMLVIFSFSARSVPTSSEVYWQDFLVKKTAHLIEYAILSLLLYRGFKATKIKYPYVWAFVLTVLYAFSDEYHQSFIFGRQSRLRDVVFDTIGSLSGLYLIWKFLPKAPAKLKAWVQKWLLV
jgi:VanZ family protein